MPYPTAPSTKAIGTAIVAYLAALTKPDTTAVYKIAQLELIYDILNTVSDGGAVAEVYGNLDDSERHGFGGAGRMKDIQTWYILSMCSVETPALAAYIYDVRDYLVQPFQQHALLGSGATIPGVFHSQLKPNGRFWRVRRNEQWFKAHLVELETRAEWAIPGGVIS